MTSQELRTLFVEFFRARGHTPVPSASLIPEEETGLLFTTAGMLPFRNYYPNPARAPYPRAVTVQKCLRAGGKDSDLANVGRTARHMTFFEMLGNFSFGDYFKEEAVEWAWEFVTGVLRLPREKLWVSVFEEDDAAFEIWRGTAGLTEDRIVRLTAKDNFWGPAGLFGVCGPCSEIYFDLGSRVGCGLATCRPGCDCDRYVEFWNLVFPEFFQEADGTRRPLARPGIDTGMGLERLAAVVEGVPTVFETDLLRPLTRAVRDLSSASHPDKQWVSTIADHGRALTFAVADGILPSNEGRGYVLRRILRRAVRGGQAIGIEGPFLGAVVGAVIDVMHTAYPDVSEQREHIARVVSGEETRFLRTLEHGAGMFENIVAALRASGDTVIPGEEAFRLYDTYGFPLDLTEEMAAERGLTVDRVGFESRMEGQRVQAKGTSRLGRAEQTVGEEWGPESRFVGYETDAQDTRVTALFRDGKPVARAGAGEHVDVSLEETPFYGESGGQVGDRGSLEGDGVRVEVLDTARPAEGIFHHRCRVVSGAVEVGTKVTARIDAERRRAIERHHTSTHLLQAALRETLGKHVKQSGSLVGPDSFRFDFSHPSAVDPVTLREVERRVGRMVLANAPVETVVTEVARAREMGALAFFGDKYGALARVVRIPGVSMELCGGTHVRALGEIGAFRMVRESSIGAGLRRIEAVSGEAAYELSRRQADVLTEVAEVLRGAWEEAPEKARQLAEARAKAEKKVEELELRGTDGGLGKVLAAVETVGERALLAARVDGMDAAGLGRIIDEARAAHPSGVFVLASALDRKVVVVVGVTEDLAASKVAHAGNVARDLTRALGGNGGGKPTFAQGSGQTPERIEEALESTRRYLREALRGG
jgi:alanyl-tRNA synthetase